MNQLLPRGISRSLLYFFTLFSCLAGSFAAHAQSAESFELKASVEYASVADKYLMVYTSNEVLTGPAIYARILNTDGSPAGPDFKVSKQVGAMTKPVLSFNAKTERFLIVWGRKNFGEKRAEIVGMTFGLDGGLVREEFRISTSNLYDQRPAIAHCPGRDRFLVTWTRGPEYDFKDGVADVYGQFVDGDGVRMLGENFVIAAAARNQFKSDIECDVINDRFLVVWEDQRTLASSDDIYGQLISSDGPLIGGNFLISSTSDTERRPVISANTKDGSYLVVWESEQPSGLTTLSSRVIDSNGQLLRTPTTLAPNVGGSRGRAAIAYLRSEDVYLVIFDNTAIGEISDGVYGQFVAANGKLRQTGFPMTTAKLGQFRPDVAASRYTFLGVWTDYRNTENKNTERDVYEFYGRVIGNDVALSERWRNPNSR